jgi:hypothetical protein
MSESHSSESVDFAFVESRTHCGIIYHLILQELVWAVFQITLADLHFNLRLSMRDICYDFKTFKLLQSILLT